MYADVRRRRAAITIQKNVRGWLARKRVANIKKQITICQAAVRRWHARRLYKQLRTEARSLEHVKKLNKGLENKIISLQQRLNESLDKNKMIEPLQTQIHDLKSKMEAYRQMELEIKTLKSSLTEKNSAIASLQKNLECERDSTTKLREQMGVFEREVANQREAWLREKERFENDLRMKEEEHNAVIKECEARHAAERRAIEAELEIERSSRQKLLSSQYELQERLDSHETKAPQSKQHQRSLSDSSNHSQQEAGVEDDYGYGSVRSVESTRPALEAVNWAAGSNTGPAPIADAGLVLRMQSRLAAVHNELHRIQRRCSELEERLAARVAPQPGGASAERFRAEELEIENGKLRARLEQLRGAGDSELERQREDEVIELRKELDRRRDECIQLKSVLSNQTINLKSLASSNYGQDVDIINEDGELAQAFEAQKLITRQLEDELTAEKKFFRETILEYKAECERLREECDKAHKLLASGLTAEGKSPAELFAQNEIVRLSAENLELRERIDRLSESVRLYKNQIKTLADKLKETGVEDVSIILENGGPAAPNANSSLVLMPNMRKREREYLGMFDYRIQDEGKIIKKLVYDLKPSVAVTLLPGLPAYIMLMMLRHMDYTDDEPKMHMFMKAMRLGVKKTLKKRSESFEYSALWLANMLRLLNNLRQYSGDEMYQHANTPRQNQQCFRIFDLSQYRQVLSDIAVWIYQGLITLLEKQLERLIFPAILEHEEISGLSGPARAASSPGAGGSGPARLKAELSRIRDTLVAYHVDPPLVMTIFKQLLYFICAFSLNQLLLRKDLCCWAKGLQIRYNISHLETWIKEKMTECGQKNIEELLGVLRPITQAVQLLQARKSMQDVQSTVDMCSDLTAIQVCKILNMYTPAEEYEIKITNEFIHEIQRKMQERAGNNSDKEPQQNLLMDSKLILGVQFPFSPSPIRLEDIELPDVLGLEGLLVKI